MTDEKNMTTGSPYAPWDLRRLPNFDFSEFLCKVEKPNGKGQTVEMTLEGIQVHTFAFRGTDFLHKAGYQEPPADSCQLVYDGELVHPREWTENNVLERIFSLCNDDLPEGCQGHSLSMSDVVELYDGDSRDFFYCDEDGFTPVRFDAEQAAPMREADGDE